MTIRSISQINDIKHLFYIQSAIVKNHNGLYWVSSLLDVSIPAGGEYFVAMELSDVEIELLTYDITTNALDADIELHEGGAFSGGTPLDFTNTNRVLDTAVPAVSSAYGVTIDTAGPDIITAKVRGNASRTSSTSYVRTTDNSGLIMKPNTVYYFHVTNNDVGAKFFDFYFKISQHTD